MLAVIVKFDKLTRIDILLGFVIDFVQDDPSGAGEDPAGPGKHCEDACLPD
jgi:hypothetical protein